MGENFENIIQRQQELEYLKKQTALSPKELRQLSRQINTEYSKKIIKKCLGVHTQMKIHKLYKLSRSLRKTVLFLTFFAIIIYLWFFLAFYFQNIALENNKEQSPNAASSSSSISLEDSPIFQFQDAVNNDDLEKAWELVKENGFKPDNFANSITFSKLYEKEKNYDMAAKVLIDYITNDFGTQNIIGQSPLYTQLSEVGKYELSPTIKTDYDSCMDACKSSAANFASLSALIDTGKYETALQLCNDLHESGVYYSMLFEFYNTCYTKLKEYADFLIDLTEQLPKTEEYDTTLPNKYRIRDCLKKIYPKVSPETQKRIDDLNIL